MEFSIKLTTNKKNGSFFFLNKVHQKLLEIYINYASDIHFKIIFSILMKWLLVNLYDDFCPFHNYTIP